MSWFSLLPSQGHGNMETKQRPGIKEEKTATKDIKTVVLNLGSMDTLEVQGNINGCVCVDQQIVWLDYKERRPGFLNCFAFNKWSTTVI